MYLEGLVSEAQKRGHIICPPKRDFPFHPENYRPFTILNTDYKILTRIIANRLRTRTDELLDHNQYCGRSDRSISDAVATVRDIIAYAEDTQKPTCLVSIDFKDAFDKISHNFISNILRGYGISDTFCKRLNMIYTDTTLILTLNGHTSTQIKILSGVGRGCALSKIFFCIVRKPASH